MADTPDLRGTMELLLTGLALLAIACGSTVNVGRDKDEDLFGDHESGEVWRDAASERGAALWLYGGTSRVVAFTVDERNIYMLLYVPERSRVRLDVCPFHRCGSERRTLLDMAEVAATSMSPTRLIAEQGTLYWTGGADTPPATLLACEIDGCADGPERIRTGPIAGIASDADSVYLVLDDGESSIVRRRHGRGNPLERVSVTRSPGVREMIAYGDSLYLVSRWQITRVFKDGSGVQDVITGQTNIEDATVGTRGVCFATGLLSGGLFCCPHTGCTGDAHPLVVPQRWPAGVILDESDVFWTTNVRPNSPNWKRALLRCALPDCAAPQVIRDDARIHVSWTSEPVLAMNGSFVFWVDQLGWNERLRMVTR